MLENKVVELGIVVRATDSTIGRALKKTLFSPTLQLKREWSPKPEYGWIPANLCDLSKG